jgi:flagellar biosynthesis/type III secretory pathway M-ring protein FliF/YscJ
MLPQLLTLLTLSLTALGAPLDESIHSLVSRASKGRKSSSSSSTIGRPVRRRKISIGGIVGVIIAAIILILIILIILYLMKRRRNRKAKLAGGAAQPAVADSHAQVQQYPPMAPGGQPVPQNGAAASYYTGK